MNNLLCGLIMMLSVCGCSPTVKMPEFSKRTPDILMKDTDVVLNDNTPVLLNRGTDVQTPETPIEAILGETVNIELDSKLFELQKNTKLTIPPNTRLVLSEPTNVKLESGSGISLKGGTEVTITKFNWYALLFYLVLIGLAAWWYFKGFRSSKQSKLLNE